MCGRPARGASGRWRGSTSGSPGRIARTGAVEQSRLRPWATVLQRADDRRGGVAEGGGPGTAFEVGLYELLARVVPDRVLMPIAVDAGRGWVVLPDGGPPLGERLDGRELVATRCDALAAVRRAAARAGAARRRAARARRRATCARRRCRARFEEALAAVGRDVRRRERPRGDRPGGRAARHGRGWCERLAAAPVPASLDHNDLHPWNVLADAAGRVRFYDWGDSVVAHPFASMLRAARLRAARVSARRSTTASCGCATPTSSAFADLAPHAELVETLELACRVGKIARALTWHRALSGGPRAGRGGRGPGGRRARSRGWSRCSTSPTSAARERYGAETSPSAVGSTSCSRRSSPRFAPRGRRIGRGQPNYHPRGKGEESSIRRRCRPGSGARRRAVRGRRRRGQHAAPAQGRHPGRHARAHADVPARSPTRTTATARPPRPATRPRSPMSSGASRAPATRPSGTRSTFARWEQNGPATLAARGPAAVCRGHRRGARLRRAAVLRLRQRDRAAGRPRTTSRSRRRAGPGAGTERLRARGLAGRRPGPRPARSR